MRVTEAANGSRVVGRADEGAILRTQDGRYLEVFIVDCRGRYFCETVDVGETAA